MVLFIFFLLAPLRLVLGRTLLLLLGLGLVFLHLVTWRGVIRFLLIFAAGRVFGVGPVLDVHGSLQLLNSSHVRERDKALLRSIMVGGVWNGFFLNRVRGLIVPCRFCGSLDGDGPSL